jgi:hypothetical protein
MVKTEALRGRAESEISRSDFRLEYKGNVSDQALIDDITSYLGEYRFNLPKFSYTLKFSNGRLRDPHRGDPMQDLTQRSIDKKVSEGNRTSRERAEKRGIMSLDHQLISAKNEDTIVWASPPGPKEEGYGDYGFVFIGQVKEHDTLEKTIQMTAIRVESPTIGQFNRAIYLLTDEKTDYQTDEEFLANPKVLNKHLEEGYVDALLGRSFSFKPNQEEQEKFEMIMRQMSPLISDFIRSVKNPWKSKEEKIKELYALENYALKLKEDYARPERRRDNFMINYNSKPTLAGITGEYGHEPPKVAGSCPTSSNSNILSKSSVLNSLFDEQEWFHCPKCGYQATGPIGDTCPECKITKEEYAQKTGRKCD